MRMIASSRGVLTICANESDICQAKEKQSAASATATRTMQARRVTVRTLGPLPVSQRLGSLHWRRIQQTSLLPQGIHSAAEFQRRVLTQISFEYLCIVTYNCNKHY